MHLGIRPSHLQISTDDAGLAAVIATANSLTKLRQPAVKAFEVFTFGLGIMFSSPKFFHFGIVTSSTIEAARWLLEVRKPVRSARQLPFVLGSQLL